MGRGEVQHRCDTCCCCTGAVCASAQELESTQLVECLAGRRSVPLLEGSLTFVWCVAGLVRAGRRRCPWHVGLLQARAQAAVQGAPAGHAVPQVGQYSAVQRIISRAVPGPPGQCMPNLEYLQGYTALRCCERGMWNVVTTGNVVPVVQLQPAVCCAAAGTCSSSTSMISTT